ncbi:MAG: aspartate/glutamate racemase family protein [Lachnospiraceae bacterium]|nr:aspartate/glutamate racemase family protein [Lachnospiraceae bacterium]
MKDKKTLGVIGGLGPMATAYFMQLVIEMTEAENDQQHFPMIVYSMPQIPDRTKYLLGVSEESPIEPIIQCGRSLHRDGADVIAIPCITAHAMHEQIQEGIELPVIHAIWECVSYLKERKIKRVGLEATDGTVQTAVFQRALEAAGIDVVLPGKEGQAKVMDIIYGNVKAGVPVNMEAFSQVEEELREAGAQVIILGCTELSMVKRDYPLPDIYLDALEVLARAAVLRCGTLRADKVELILQRGK